MSSRGSAQHVWRRRSFLWWIAGGAIVSALGLIYTIVIAPRWLHVIRLRVELPGLPPDWDGLRIAHLSDFHAGGLGVSDAVLHRARNAACAFNPDVIALTGDFHDAKARMLHADLFNGWPAGTQVLGVIGNHDVHPGDAWLESALQQFRHAGIHILRNTAVAVPLRGQNAWVVGVDDPFSRMSDDSAAFSAMPESEVALLYLAHSPEVLSSMPEGRSRLLLCGHTHGGQVRLLPSGRMPFNKLLWRLFEDGPRSEPSIHRGYHWVGSTAVVISDGLGTSVIPVRFRTRPQALLIELAAVRATPEGNGRITVLNPEPFPVSWLS